jgi:hypothetical protein
MNSRETSEAEDELQELKGLERSALSSLASLEN